MATKWVDQMPKPTEMAAISSHTFCIVPVVPRAWLSRLTPAKEARAQITAARATSRKSCSKNNVVRTACMIKIGPQAMTTEST